MALFKRNKTENKLSSFDKTSLATEVKIKQVLGISRLEPMPLQAARAFQLAGDPKATTSDFVKIIESDEALSARIIRIANSVYFRRGEEAKDIEKAVANVGLDELRCLISATMLRSLLQGKHAARDQIWGNSVGTAICCRGLASYTSCSEGEAFLSGLLHDVGKLIMLLRAPKQYEKVLTLVAKGEKAFCEAEEQFFDLNHVEVGKWIAERWNFPTAAAKAIANHHNPWPTGQERKGRNTEIAILVKASDIIAHSAALGQGPAMRNFRRLSELELPSALSQLQINNQDSSALLERFQKQFSEELGLYQMDAL